jgi:hypothetical protein
MKRRRQQQRQSDNRPRTQRGQGQMALDHFQGQRYASVAGANRAAAAETRADRLEAGRRAAGRAAEAGLPLVLIDRQVVGSWADRLDVFAWATMEPGAGPLMNLLWPGLGGRAPDPRDTDLQFIQNTILVILEGSGQKKNRELWSQRIYALYRAFAAHDREQLWKDLGDWDAFTIPPVSSLSYLIARSAAGPVMIRALPRVAYQPLAMRLTSNYETPDMVLSLQLLLERPAWIEQWQPLLSAAASRGNVRMLRLIGDAIGYDKVLPHAAPYLDADAMEEMARLAGGVGSRAIEAVISMDVMMALVRADAQAVARWYDGAVAAARSTDFRNVTDEGNRTFQLIGMAATALAELREHGP